MILRESYRGPSPFASAPYPRALKERTIVSAMSAQDNATAQGPGSRSRLSRRAGGVAPSVIVEMSRLAQERGAINLAEGYPDFPAPERVKEEAIRAISADVNQYRYDDDLAAVVADHFWQTQGVRVDPDTEVVLAVGQTGALASALLAVLDPGDEVLLLDPSFEAYKGAIQLAGGVPVHVRLQCPSWDVNPSALSRAVTPRTKAIVVNSPCNPTGKVFARDELLLLADLCQRHNLLAFTDEVYEHFVYDEGARHISLACLPGMRARTVVTSSLSKAFSVTGWRIGWAIAPPDIAAAIGAMSLKLVDSPPAPFQEAAKAALRMDSGYFTLLKEEFIERRDRVVAMLEDMGLEVPTPPQGGYFALARLPDAEPLNDVEFCKLLINKSGVAFVPGCIFFGRNPASDQFSCSSDSRFVRVAFCKRMETLETAQKQLKGVDVKESVSI